MKNKKPARLRQKHFAWLLLAVLGFIALTAITVLGWLEAAETSVFRYFYGASDSFKWFALIVTQFGSTWFLLALVGLLFIIRRKPDAAVSLIINSAIAYILVFILKLLIARPRPMELFDDITTREVITYGLGYPSGHTALATVAALTLLPYLPVKYRFALAAAWIGLVAWSRVYLGVHSPLDVVAGFILGLIVVLSVDYLPRKGWFKGL